MPRLPPEPDLTWCEDGASLAAAAFGDIYFSKEGGLAEAEAVFLAGAGLPEGWRGKDRFALCELGFGTGLNLLATWRAWRLSRQPHAQLHISTIEAFPLAKQDAARALAHFPELADLDEKLLGQWPVRAYAPQRLWFPEDGVSINVHTGDAEAILAGLRGSFDAWYLDGFAPAKNPHMWSPSLLRHVARLSAPGARLASFTVAGDVRRGLESAGFTVERKPGFGRKRERLEARYTGAPTPSGSLYSYAASTPKRVAVLGAGIAGAACARALARRDVECVVIDGARTLGAGASGNPAGLVMPRLDRGDGPMRELFLAAYVEAVASYAALGAGVCTQCGVAERAHQALADMLDDPPLPADWFAPSGDGALHLKAGVVRPVEAIRAWLKRATLVLEATFGAIEDVGDGWIVRALDGRALVKADAVIFACGVGFAAFEPTRFLPLRQTQGQIEWGPCARPPLHAHVDGNYVAPFEGGVLFGATFDRELGIPTISGDARRRNVEALTKLAPEVADHIDVDALTSRAGVRVSMPDHAPFAGLLPDADRWLAQYAALAHGGPVDASAPPPAYRGVYVVGGLGARGLTLAPLLGERIASEMFGEPQTLSARTLDAIHPARFLHRALKRR